MSDDTTPALYCANHPDRATMLRCNRCDRPICYRCAVRTPVGYRCKECVREQQSVYFTGERFDLPIAVAIGIVLGAVVGALAYAVLGMFGWFSFIVAFLAGPAAGGAIAEAIRQGVGRRRTRWLNLIAAATAVMGILLGGALLLVFYRGWPPGLLFTRLDILILGGLAAGAIYARLS
jgi:MFS family permease